MSVSEVIKNKGGRPRKNEKYDSDRKMVIEKLLKILNVSEKNKIVYFDELDKDIVKQEQILALKDEVKKYFNCGRWSIFAKKNIKLPYFSLLRSILRASEYKITGVQLKGNNDGKSIKRGILIN